MNTRGNVSTAYTGFKEVTTSASGAFFAIQADGDATFSATSVSGDNLSSLARIDGTVIYGNFSAVAVSSGKVLAYYK